MTGKVLRDVIASDRSVREAAMFGIHGGQVNVTDGRYVYMRGCANEANSPLFQYTLMPMHMNRMFEPRELTEIEMAGPLSFSKGCRVMKIPSRRPKTWLSNMETMLFDLQTDPKQEKPIKDAAVEKRMIELMTKLMREVDAPAEQYERLGI
jgi:hypothetical protein